MKLQRLRRLPRKILSQRIKVLCVCVCVTYVTCVCGVWCVCVCVYTYFLEYVPSPKVYEVCFRKRTINSTIIITYIYGVPSERASERGGVHV